MNGYLLENRRMVTPGGCWYIYGLTMWIKPTLYIQDVFIACGNHVLSMCSLHTKNTAMILNAPVPPTA